MRGLVVLKDLLGINLQDLFIGFLLTYTLLMLGGEDETFQMILVMRAAKDVKNVPLNHSHKSISLLYYSTTLSDFVFLSIHTFIPTYTKVFIQISILHSMRILF